MKYDFTQIEEIILKNPNKALVSKGVEYSKRCRFHLFGENKESYIALIEGFEKSKKIREQFAKSNKDAMERLLNPRSAIYSAKGGSFYTNLSDSSDAKARLLASNISNGLSLKKWIETILQPQADADPFGHVLLEILPKEEKANAIAEGMPYVYPVYKSIQDIYDIPAPNGNKYDYVCYNYPVDQAKKLGLKGKVYRFIDDAFDYIITIGSTNGKRSIEIQSQYTLPNFFGFVPAYCNSDIDDPSLPGGKLSIIDKIMELAEHYMMDSSLKTYNKFYFAFPKYAELADDCKACQGTGVKGNDDCEKCGGSGRSLMVNPSQRKAVRWPEKDIPAVLPSDVAAFIEPTDTFQTLVTGDMATGYRTMYEVLWGTAPSGQTSGPNMQQGNEKTATQAVLDLQPQNNRLEPCSQWVENRFKFIFDNVVRVQMSMPGYQGCSYSAGRRYLIESPDVLWDKYSRARHSGAPTNVLDDMLNEYFDTKFKSDPVGLEVQKKLMYVEPLVHYSVVQVSAIPGISTDELSMKVYYSDWLATKSESELVLLDIPQLREDLSKYSRGKITQPAA